MSQVPGLKNMRILLILLIRFYQVVFSPLMGGCCRFYPSCSNYGIEAIQRHGWLRGAWLSARRFCKCHPFGAGGFDPVPEPPVCSHESAIASPQSWLRPAIAKQQGSLIP